jgi:hypothetical protein
MWYSFTVVTGRWINKEVVLPFPLSFDVAYILYVDIMFALTNKSICWVDLLKGILIYDNVI